MKKENAVVVSRFMSNHNSLENYFILFNLPISFDIDRKMLDKAYFANQIKYHPDQSTNKPHPEKVAILNMSMVINKAYKVLKNPLKRAEYILSLHNIIVNSENDNFKADKILLAEILDDQERVEGAHTKEDLVEIENHLKFKQDQSIKNISDFFKQNILEKAAKEAIKLKYIEKTLSDVRLKNKF